MQIDKIGFNQDAAKKMTERDFVELHLKNDAILPKLERRERVEWLRNAYKELVGNQE